MKLVNENILSALKNKRSGKTVRALDSEGNNLCFNGRTEWSSCAKAIQSMKSELSCIYFQADAFAPGMQVPEARKLNEKIIEELIEDGHIVITSMS